MKHFFKGTLFFLAFNLTYFVTVYAQTIDYNQINQEIEEDRRRQRQIKTPIEKSTFARLLGLEDIIRKEFPKKEKLTATEENYVPLFKCMEKIIQKGKGGGKRFDVISNILSKVLVDDKLVDDSYSIQEATDECKYAYKNLKTGSGDSSNVERSPNIQRYIRSVLGRGIDACESRTFKAGAFFVLGAEVGLVYARCLTSNGEVLQYIGPKASLAAGFGVMLGTTKRNDFASRGYSELIVEGSVSKAVYSTSSYVEGDYAFLSMWDTIDTNDFTLQAVPDIEKAYLGVGIQYSFGGEVAFRILPSARRWERVIRIFK